MTSASDRIWEMARAYQPSRVLLTGVELGVFGALGDESRTSAEVATAIGTDPRATDRLMNALVAMDLLTKEGDRFANAPDARTALVPGRPDYVGAALMHVVDMWKSWSTLTEAVRAGTSVIRAGEASWGAERAQAFMAAMHHIATAQSDEIISRIDLTGVKRMIDIGGGSGAYSIAFCKARPEIESIVFDRPEVVPITKRYVEEAGFSDRITTHTGDFNRDPLPSGFDLAFMSQILHSNSPDENAQLAKTVYGALNPKGQIVIQEFVIDETRTSPPSHAFFSLNMLVGTTAGDTFTESEIRGWLQSAGFESITRVDPPTNTTLMIGRKSG